MCEKYSTPLHNMQEAKWKDLLFLPLSSVVQVQNPRCSPFYSDWVDFTGALHLRNNDKCMHPYRKHKLVCGFYKVVDKVNYNLVATLLITTW